MVDEHEQVHVEVDLGVERRGAGLAAGGRALHLVGGGEEPQESLLGGAVAKKGKRLRLRLRLIQGFTFFLMKSMVIDVVIRGTVVVELDPVPDLGSRRHDSGRG